MKTNLMKFRLSLVAGLIGAKTTTPYRAKNLQIYPTSSNHMLPQEGGTILHTCQKGEVPVGVPNAALKRNPIVQNGFVKHVKLDCA